jgi:hypothetical protein
METNILTAVMAVFQSVINWIVGAVETVTPMFYGTEGLTFLGILGVASLAFSVAFLVIGIVQSFLKFRS